MKIYLIYLLTTSILLITAQSRAQQNLELSVYSNQTEIKSTGSIRLLPGFTIPAGSTVRIYIESVPTAIFASSPSSDQNYVSSKIFKVAGVNSGNIINARSASEVNQTIQYVDGLGRAIQNITVQGSPGFKDLVQPISYDAFGREIIKYLTYAPQDASNGIYRTSGISDIGSFYSSPPVGIKATAYPYSETVFESSPLNRLLQQGAPGATWQIANHHTTEMDYATNAANEVRLWTISGSVASGTTYYAVGKLYKTISRDENTPATQKAGSIEEFKDFEGRVVLKRLWENENKSLSTYYVYNDMGNLQYVLPPVVNENGVFNLSSFSESDETFIKYIYGYHYDGRNRLTEKKIPGKSWEYMVYNQLDQMVLSQDGIQRGKATPEWSFTKYDASGRIVISGIYASTATASSLLASVNSATLWESPQSGGNGYSSVAFPQSGGDNYQINYYDNYDFPGAGNYTFTGGSSQTKSLLTGSQSRVLGSNTMLQSVNYYDAEGRLIKNFHQHYLGGVSAVGNYDETTNTYDFAGLLKSSSRSHHANSAVTTIDTRMEYDHQGRLSNTYKNINGQGEILLSGNTYNEIGQLLQKKLHSGLQTTGYAYNERGWLKSVSSSEFSESLNYEDGTSPQWNGNIANQQWGTGSSFPNTFSYSYDPLNRLISASSTGVTMSESLSYDVMGNISQLTRDGSVGNYNYAGNQLSQITGALGTGSYNYDANGNVTTDGRNGVTLSYNYLSLPQTVSKQGLAMNYVYDASGAKLRKVSNTVSTDYVGGIQYTNGNIDFIQTEEGVARNNSGTYSYEYNLSDHLGNNRVTFYKNPVTGALEKLQQDDYYAFGLRKVAQNGVNKYLYNKKELQEELGQYDYGARFYDPVIGRWNVIDALAENHHSVTPYNYVLNNPINTIDPFGLDTVKANQVTPEVWHNFNTSGDNIGLNEVSITATRGASKAQAAYSSVQSEVQSNYRKQSGGLFMGYPDNLQGRVNSTFHERYIAHNEINPFSGQGRVVGLQDANWITDLMAGGIISLTRTGIALAAEGGYTTVFRAVSQAELDDIAQFGFRTQTGGYETGKLFAPTFHEATQFGKANFMFDGIPNTVMKVRVPNSVMNSSYRFGADGMNAISIPSSQLHLLRGTPFNFSSFAR
jgi:RHS repeat-associated protein